MICSVIDVVAVCQHGNQTLNRRDAPHVRCETGVGWALGIRRTGSRLALRIGRRILSRGWILKGERGQNWDGKSARHMVCVRGLERGTVAGCKEMLSVDGECLVRRTVNKGAVGFDANVAEMVKYGHENES